MFDWFKNRQKSSKAQAKDPPQQTLTSKTPVVSSTTSNANQQSKLNQSQPTPVSEDTGFEWGDAVLEMCSVDDGLFGLGCKSAKTGDSVNEGDGEGVAEGITDILSNDTVQEKVGETVRDTGLGIEMITENWDETAKKGDGKVWPWIADKIDDVAELGNKALSNKAVRKVAGLAPSAAGMAFDLKDTAESAKVLDEVLTDEDSGLMTQGLSMLSTQLGNAQLVLDAIDTGTLSVAKPLTIWPELGLTAASIGVEALRDWSIGNDQNGGMRDASHRFQDWVLGDETSANLDESAAGLMEGGAGLLSQGVDFGQGLLSTGMGWMKSASDTVLGGGKELLAGMDEDDGGWDDRIAGWLGIADDTVSTGLEVGEASANHWIDDKQAGFETAAQGAADTVRKDSLLGSAVGTVDEVGGDALHALYNDPKLFQHAAMGSLAFGPLGMIQMLPLMQAKAMGAGS
jgi:hypothetical protein